MKEKFLSLAGIVLAGMWSFSMQVSAAEAVTQAQPVRVQAAVEHVDGGWAVQQGRTALNRHVKQVFNKALDGLVGADYEPVALLGTQVVAGKNYAILCRITPTVLHPVTHWGVAYVYEDLQGNAKLLEVRDLELGY
jgi:hypothetical protein